MKKIFGWTLKYPGWGLVIALLIAVAGLIPGRSIPIRLSLMDLLPDQRESVRHSKEIAQEVGGVGYLFTMIGPTDHPEQYLPQLARAFEGDPDLRYSFYERETYVMRDRAPFLLPQDEFNKLLSNTETLIFKGKVGGLLDLGFGDPDEDNARVSEARKFFADLREKHMGGSGNFEGSAQRYFLSKDQRYAVFAMKPAFDAEMLDRSVALIDKAQTRVQQVLTDKVPFRLMGRYVNHAHDVNQIEKDIAITSIVSTLLMLLVLYVGLGSFRSALISVLCVTISMGPTLGFAVLAVGQINIITGFLLAILGGLGVEYGVHLIRRYYQERALGKTFTESLDVVYWNTGHALFSAALTSAGAFLILAISDFRAFSELGLIAGFGILAIYFTYMLAFPFFCRWLPEKPISRRGIQMFGYYPFRMTWAWMLPVVAVAMVYGIQKTRFEYDFEKMRQLSSDAVQANAIMDEIMVRSTTPLAILAKDVTQAHQVQDWLENDARKHAVHSAISLANLVPPDIQERYEKLRTFSQRASKIPDETIRRELNLDPALVRRWLATKPYGRADLPAQFRDAFGHNGNIVLVYANVNLSTFQGIKEIVATLLEAKAKFPELKVGGDTRIFKEILDHIFTDGPRVLLMFLLGAFLVLWLEFRSIKDALELEMQLILGIALLVGMMGLFGIPFSIINIGMIPAVLACGIDIGVHIRHREEESGDSPMNSARFVAQAVQLSVATTLIGFGSLFLAKAGMLKGIAWISVLGQSTMYFICMFAWPISKTILHTIQNQKQPSAMGSRE